VPFSQAELMVSAMQRANGEVKLLRVPKGEHRFPLDVSEHPEWPDVFGEMVRWLDGHLKRAGTK
jgi:dipeptidyl aminopeptidase/acylaminoacyl peptidase